MDPIQNSRYKSCIHNYQSTFGYASWQRKECLQRPTAVSDSLYKCTFGLLRLWFLKENMINTVICALHDNMEKQSSSQNVPRFNQLWTGSSTSSAIVWVVGKGVTVGPTFFSLPLFCSLFSLLRTFTIECILSQQKQCLIKFNGLSVLKWPISFM